MFLFSKIKVALAIQKPAKKVIRDCHRSAGILTQENFWGFFL